MWTGKDGLMGMKFLNVDEQAVRLIKGYIHEKTDKRAKAGEVWKKVD